MGLTSLLEREFALIFDRVYHQMAESHNLDVCTGLESS